MALKKRLGLGSLMRRRSSQDVPTDSGADTPDANAARGVRLFCESGGANSGEEVLHLPTIVEAAESSPSAAAASAVQIRTYLSKENYKRPHVQYNAIMLIRILADNPGPSFTKNLDKNFAETVKHLLRNGQDPSVSQILRETLDAMERDKAYDTNLKTVFAMWKKEKGLMENAAKSFGPRKLNAPGWSSGQQFQGGFGDGGSRSRSKGLPPPVELVGRIEEARTSAKLLLQLVQSTPPAELIGNDLVKEFAERCTSAQRSIQGYIACDSPAPDDDTMLTLIETNEQLSLAASKHQRAVLQARRAIGVSPSPPVQQQQPPPTLPLVNVAPSGVPTNSYEASLPALPQRHDVPAPMDSVPQDPYNPLPNMTPHGAPTSQTPTVQALNNSALPSSLQAAPNRQSVVPKQQEENPFADHYTSAYTPPTNPRSNGYGGSPDSYHPGFQSTPSYIHRQESATNNLTMHGAVIQEEERPRTPEHNAAQPRQHDVSPIAERNTVTYRY
ncbi:uncharacterized protein M421DRAFT_426880 [Didymella exigua CBS 183.55]|uniref:GAT domain-containing protein n=1 Tax=Didymella exigua CBS 183.55 TaxID=1150837 RepID=A0A6A5R344_9PLEO|nr:uncharacterized protein M421DRAFT_426880 [Didymella exigua CBS 183.55]KAF1922485.1 hypothetical protein M421DRAFT_426880 [Didymella exigua CBS 183.55]